MALQLQGLEIATWPVIDAWLADHVPALLGGTRRGKIAKVNQERRQRGMPEYGIAAAPNEKPKAVRVNSPWPGRDDELRALWADETKSTAQIGKEMGLSKNAVVGHAGRIGLSRASPIVHAAKKAAPPGPTADARTAAAREIMRDISASMLDGGVIVALPAPRPLSQPVQPVATGWRAKPCAFPMWGHNERPGLDPKFCDAPVKEGSVYCPSHHRTCYTVARTMTEEERAVAHHRQMVAKAHAATARR